MRKECAIISHNLIFTTLQQIRWKPLYRVTHLLANLGWVDFDFGCSTLCLVLPGQMVNWQNWMRSWARWWNIPNQSQPNPGLPGDVSPYISLIGHWKRSGKAHSGASSKLSPPRQPQDRISRQNYSAGCSNVHNKIKWIWQLSCQIANCLIWQTQIAMDFISQ